MLLVRRKQMFWEAAVVVDAPRRDVVEGLLLCASADSYITLKLIAFWAPDSCCCYFQCCGCTIQSTHSLIYCIKVKIYARFRIGKWFFGQVQNIRRILWRIYHVITTIIKSRRLDLIIIHFCFVLNLDLNETTQTHKNGHGMRVSLSWAENWAWASS